MKLKKLLIGRSCDEITCSESELCLVTELAERELTAAQCIPSPDLFIPETCATLQCNEGSVCVDLQVDGFSVRGICLETNCANSSITVCDGGSTCIAVPPEVETLAESLCVVSQTFIVALASVALSQTVLFAILASAQRITKSSADA